MTLNEKESDERVCFHCSFILLCNSSWALPYFFPQRRKMFFCKIEFVVGAAAEAKSLLLSLLFCFCWLSMELKIIFCSLLFLFVFLFYSWNDNETTEMEIIVGRFRGFCFQTIAGRVVFNFKSSCIKQNQNISRSAIKFAFKDIEDSVRKGHQFLSHPFSLHPLPLFH